MKKKIIRFSAVAGILIFGFIIYKIGPEEIEVELLGTIRNLVG